MTKQKKDPQGEIIDELRKPLRFTKHAFERLFERNLSPKECEQAFISSKIIESYPDDKPFPSELRLGYANGKVIHLVIAENEDVIHVITAYEPDRELWSDDFSKSRRKEDIK